MAKENVTNFATTTLNGGITAVATSFAVQTGGGATFPTVGTTNPQGFIVAIDSELILCSARSGDTFTVATGGRGYEGTAAATHANAATVTHSPTAGMLNHLWSNTADSLNANVPPYARGGSAPSTWDDEFESQAGAWQFNPGMSGGDSLDFNVAKSCMRFRRADFSNNSYVVYKPFVPGGPALTAMCRMSHGARLFALSGPSWYATPLEVSFFVSDQTTPSATDTGNMARIDHNLGGYNWPILNAGGSAGPLVSTPIIKATVLNNNVPQNISFMPGQGVQYYRIDYDGNGNWYFWYGDGLTWTGLSSMQKTINVQSIGFRFWISNGVGTITKQEAAIDWLRVSVGGTIPPTISY